ncbi:rod shape determining protein RodA [Elusimicrobium posterum]|uniref:FtsW/RodA/SpoVE family cell cycle protein n=1 Tax=Elusimicrobium posterum TaxID=3116653 RepID=UPI003C78FE4B
MFDSGQEIKRSNVDWIYIGAIFLLVLLGTLSIMSAVWGTSMGPGVVRTHMLALPIGITVFFAGWIFNYQIYDEQWKFLYGGVIMVLIAVLIFGTYQRGSRSWFTLPFFSIQPSELCRIAVILIASAFLSRNVRRINEPTVLISVFAIIGVIFGLIMLQPDFSSIVITLPTLLALLYCAGVPIFYLFIICLFGFVAGIFPLMWTYIYLTPQLLDTSLIARIIQGLSKNIFYMMGFCGSVVVLGYILRFLLKQFRIYIPGALVLFTSAVVIAGFFAGLAADKQMKDYQRKRVQVFLAPKADPKGAGYNVLQAQIAMGSGGVLGKGLFSGTQSRLGFVPEKHTDFILAVVGEEMGLWGTLAVLGLYFVILWRIMVIANKSSDFYGYLVCCGIFSMFFVYIIINFGMLIGLVPVAGIPLPLISYGGSNFVASMWALGIVQSVYVRRLTLR